MSDARRYPIPARVHRVEDVVLRSRFITTIAHAPDADAAHAFVESVREEMPDATHHCWAFVAGPPGSTTHIGMSDAGEPHGTAGRPMLAALLHADLGEVVAVCTRYFGGTKLGTGGLSRAYSGGVVHALQALPTEERVERVQAMLTLGYAHVDAAQRLMQEMDLQVEDEEYGAEVRYRLGVPATEVENLAARIADLTRGEGELRVL